MNYLDYQIFSITDVYQLLLIFHLIGLAVGAGAAFFSDFLFTGILKDKKINSTEYRILKLNSSVVWLGLVLMAVSGLLIFFGDMERLLDTPKFLAKMSIILVLVLNGIYFHFVQIPMLRKFIDKDLSKNKTFKTKYSKKFFIGGAISGVSWVAAIVLGALPFLDMGYWYIMAIYAAAISFSIAAALKLEQKYLS